jgi:hypothetical protein
MQVKNGGKNKTKNGGKNKTEKRREKTGSETSTYIMNDLPQAEAAASMMSARLLLITCLGISLDADRMVVVKN